MVLEVINYALLVDALEYYQDQGYKLIDVPWTVPKDALKITTPSNFDFTNNMYLNKYLVGSAEQSFLYLIRTGQLKEGKYCAITPCFRNDDEDEIHQKYFMKVELIHYTRKWWKWSSSMETMIYDARQFFEQFVSTTVVETVDNRDDESYDIETNGIELGSYGIRHHENIDWIYGTGLAEPRLSIAMKQV